MRHLALPAFFVLLAAPAGAQVALDTSFTYQGRLTDASGPVSGAVDMQFRLYDEASGDNPALGTQTIAAVAVTNGLFTVALDFGGTAFNGDRRWLGISVNGDPELTPRVPLTAAPYALFALRSADAARLGGQLPAGFAPASHDHDPRYVNVSGDTMTGDLTLGAGLQATTGVRVGAAPPPPPTVAASLTLPNTIGGPTAPGIKWSDGTFANTASLALDGLGPNGLSYQGTATFPCLIVRAATSDGTSGTAMARMCADGSIVGTTKSFEEAHPTRPGQRIVYAALEGPEVALYARGTGTIGRRPVTIELPEHFSVLATADTVTALLAPVGPCPGGLYLAERDARRLVVARSKATAGTCRFDYLTVAVRARHRDFAPVRDGAP
jgi:hypothetical protein